MEKNKVKILSCISIVSIMLISKPSMAQLDDNRPDTLNDLIDCRSISDDSKRLACYDNKVGALQTAEESGDIVIADKEVLEKAQEDVFGLKVSDNPLFTGKNGARLNEISSTITSAKLFSRGKWSFTLENGSKWRQTEIVSLRRSPKAGNNVIIKRASFGGFHAIIEGQRFIKVRRVN